MKAATVLIVGRPSAGKSTLLNRLCGEKVAIVASVPQTTRNRIRGVLTDPRGQIVLIDSPGLHASERKLNRHLRSLVTESLDEVDLILYLVDSRRAPAEEELTIANMLKPRKDRLLVALTKVDAEAADAPAPGRGAASGRGAAPGRASGTGRREAPGRAAARSSASRGKASAPKGTEASRKAAAAFLSEHLAGVPVFPLSALTGEGTSALLSALFERSPEGEAMYPEEFYTDQPPEFRIAEIIRGEALRRVREEVPHSLYVQIADLELPRGAAAEEEEQQEQEERLWIRAFVVVERESQKGILVGRGGSMIKEIRVASQREIGRVFPYRIDLDLRVKVDPNWRTKDKLLDRLIY